MASPTRAAITAAACFTIALGGCAIDCFDDGLDQGGCPTAETDSNTNTMPSTMTATESGPTMSDTVATMGPASNTETVTNTETITDSEGDCPDLQEVLVPETPTFQLVVDQSGSMEEPFGGVTRWEAMKSTLVGMNGVVTDFQSSIRFGLSLYNNPMAAPECPTVDTMTPQLDAQDEIDALLNASGPEGDTPTGESIDVALQTVLDDAWVGPKFMLLATDGEPDICGLSEPMTMMEIAMVRQRAVQAVEDAFDAGVRTFVISVGEELTDEHLQDLANAGEGVGMGDPDAMFYVALDQDALLDAFASIINGLRTCEIELPSELMEQHAPSCEVTINNDPYAFGDPNGWQLNDPTHIELMGDACSAIQSGLVVIEMYCTCVPE